jgi:glucans biosynthesis protein
VNIFHNKKHAQSHEWRGLIEKWYTHLRYKFHQIDHNPMQSKNKLEKAHLSPRCGANARTTGKPCQSPAMPNGRCRMHGGKSPGAPTGKANGNYKNGLRTKRHKQFKLTLKALKGAVKQGDFITMNALTDEIIALLG